MANILIIDDADGYRELCLRYLPEHTFEPPARNYQEASAALARRGREIDLVLLDVHFDIDADQLLPADRSGLKGSEAAIQEQLRRTQGFKILEALRPRYPDLPVIVMTSVDDLPIGLDADRLDSRKKLEREMERLAAKQGERARWEERRKVRAFGRILKEAQNERRRRRGDT